MNKIKKNNKDSDNNNNKSNISEIFTSLSYNEFKNIVSGKI